MKPINYKALGAKIKEYRKKENITQEQLAEMADISLSHMSNVETASVSVSLPALKLIADALGVTIDELLVDSYSKKQKKYFYSKKMDLIMEQCETVEQEIIVNTVSTLADNLLKNRSHKLRYADGEIRTRTNVSSLRPEHSASANSATSA